MTSDWRLPWCNYHPISAMFRWQRHHRLQPKDYHSFALLDLVRCPDLTDRSTIVGSEDFSNDQLDPVAWNGNFKTLENSEMKPTKTKSWNLTDFWSKQFFLFSWFSFHKESAPPPPPPQLTWPQKSFMWYIYNSVPVHVLYLHVLYMWIYFCLNPVVSIIICSVLFHYVRSLCQLGPPMFIYR
jgi:hypothetical protein